jgi:hypothetical protein
MIQKKATANHDIGADKPPQQFKYHEWQSKGGRESIKFKSKSKPDAFGHCHCIWSPTGYEAKSGL